MWITYSFYHASWLQVFRLFQFSLFQIKMVNHAICDNIEYQLHPTLTSHITIFMAVFCIIFIKLKFFFSTLKTICKQLLWHCSSIEGINILTLKIQKFLTLIIILHLFVTSLCISIKSMAHSTSDTFLFLPLITCQYQLIDLILLWSFLRLLAMLILVRKYNEQGQVHIFPDTYFESFQTHQLTIMCDFEHTNHVIHLNFLWQNFYKLFLRARNLH